MLKIGIDLDETLNCLHSKWLDRYNNDYNDNLSYNDLKEWNMLEFVKPECGKKIYDYLKEPGFFKDLNVQRNAQKEVEVLSKFFTIYVVTAYVVESCKDKVFWIKENFPFIKEENIIFCNDKSLLSGIDVLVDDCYKNISSFKKNGILFSKPWNKGNRLFLKDEHGYKKVRANNWKDIFEKIKKLINGDLKN